jgi:hypothetical protein
MSCSRDGIFYNFSEVAPKEYKDELENIVTTYNGFCDTKTYTPYAASCAALVIAGVQTALGNDSSYSLIFNILLITVPAVQAGIMMVANGGINNFAKKGNRLIDTGVKMKFFKDVPDDLPTTNNNDTAITIQPEVHAEAIKNRSLRRA